MKRMKTFLLLGCGTLIFFSTQAQQNSEVQLKDQDGYEDSHSFDRSCSSCFSWLWSNIELNYWFWLATLYRGR